MRISDWSSDVCSSDLLEIIPVEAVVARDQPAALHQRMGAGEEVRHRADVATAALAVPALHLAGAQRRPGLGGQVADAHLLQHRQRLGAVLERTAQLGQHHVARSEEHTSELQSLMRTSY